MLQVGVRADLPVRTGGIGAQPPARAVEQRVTVALGRCEQVAIGRVRRDHVDEADDVRPVEQRGRSPRDLDPFGAVRVDRDAMVIRGAGEVARRDPVLDDVHPVPAEPADDRPARPGSEAAIRDARLVLERLADAAGRIPGSLEGVERRDDIERPERRLGPHRHFGGDGHLLAQRRQAEREIDAGRLAGGHSHRLLDGGEVLALRRDHVRAGREVRELEGPIVGERESARSENQDDRAIDRFSVLHQGHGAAQRAGLPHGQTAQSPAPGWRSSPDRTVGRRSLRGPSSGRSSGVRNCPGSVRRLGSPAKRMERMCCNLQKATRARSVESTRLRLMPPLRTAC